MSKNVNTFENSRLILHQKILSQVVYNMLTVRKLAKLIYTRTIIEIKTFLTPQIFWWGFIVDKEGM